jgi:hypothetical protein
MKFDLGDMVFPSVEEDFESFFRKELMHLKNKDAIIAILRELLIKYRNNDPLLIDESKREIILNEADSFIKKSFSLKLYNDFVKEHFILPKYKNKKEDSSFSIFANGILEALYQKNEKIKKGWNYRKTRIQEIILNLENYGLHPNLFSNKTTNLLYNVIITHNTFKKIETNKWFFMSKEQLENSIITPYQSGKKILIEGTNIPTNKIQRVRISANRFNETQVELLALKLKIKWNIKQNEYVDYFEFCEDVTNDLLKQTIEKELIKSESEKFNQLIKKLKDYAEVKKLLISAHNNLDNPELNRYALDNCRLALELVLKSLFKNDKSLENQISYLGLLLEERKVTVETRNIYIQLVKGYAKFQNENIKHNVVEISQDESQLIFETTITFINFLFGE